MDELMKIVGIRYLHETLRSTVEQVESTQFKIQSIFR